MFDRPVFIPCLAGSTGLFVVRAALTSPTNVAPTVDHNKRAWAWVNLTRIYPSPRLCAVELECLPIRSPTRTAWSVP